MRYTPSKPGNVVVRASLAALPLLALAGCVPPTEHRETRFRAEKLAVERDQCQQVLADERARVAALAQRLEAGERRQAALEAERAGLQDRAERLAEHNAALQKTIAAQAAAPLERPQVPASALPADLDEALERFAAKHTRRLWYERGRGALAFLGDLLFESGSDALQSDAQPVLREFAGLAARVMPEGYDLIIVGHTDDAPIRREETLEKHPSNWHLAVHRAIAVKEELVSAGLSARQLGVMGFGAERPAAQDPARNRRVEVFFVRRGDVQSFAPVRTRP